MNVAINTPAGPVNDMNPFPVKIMPVTSAVAGTADAIEAVDSAPDRVETPTYYDAGTADERLHTVVVSSPALGLSYTETFVYGGAAGGYYITSRTRS